MLLNRLLAAAETLWYFVCAVYVPNIQSVNKYESAFTIENRLHLIQDFLFKNIYFPL